MGSYITGALSFWNERPEDLDLCIRGLSNIADRVVVLDGAYARYPDATARSPKDQIEAIKDAAHAARLELVLEQPDKLWAGQVQKRGRLLELASQDSDWIAIVDADHVVSADRRAARSFLEREPYVDVVSVQYWTPANPDRSIEESSVGLWHEQQSARFQQIPHLFRVLPEIRVERFHWWYSAMKNGHRIWLWGGDDSRPHATEARMTAAYQVQHRTLFRTPEQIRASRAFLNDREQIVARTGQEDALPGMVPPKWNYDRVNW